MRNITTALALSALAVAGAGSVIAKEKPTGEQELAELLEGRVAGQPQQCISTSRANNLKVIEKTALVYKERDILWVNRTAAPDILNGRDVMVVNRASNLQLCKLDRITLTDQQSGFFTGFVFLRDFVPYRKVEAEQ